MPRFCREDYRHFQRIFLGVSCFCICGCFIMIILVIRERKRQQQEARGWALMEPFFVGAIFIYAIVSFFFKKYQVISYICPIFFSAFGCALLSRNDKN